MPQPADRSSLVRAFFKVAAVKGGRPWLEDNFTRATLAAACNKPRIKVLGMESENVTFEQDIGNDELSVMFMQALEMWDEEKVGIIASSTGATLTPRFRVGGIPY